jgi:hypothetical protein
MKLWGYNGGMSRFVAGGYSNQIVFVQFLARQFKVGAHYSSLSLQSNRSRNFQLFKGFGTVILSTRLFSFPATTLPSEISVS